MEQRNPFGHVDLRVKNLKESIAFYRELLHSLGFPDERGDKTWHAFDAPGQRPVAPWVVLIESPDHLPNANRLAFWVAGRGEVDSIGALLQRIDATIESGPRTVEYSPTYYAVFFRDPSGNPLEVYTRSD